MAASVILVIEDSQAIRLSVVAALTAHGFDVTGLADGDHLERHLAEHNPDLVVLDVMLPGRDGFELLAEIRRRCTAAVLMLTARDTTGDRVRGLKAGADDYLVKPFAMVELLARIHAVLRRARSGGPAIGIGALLINVDTGDVRRDGVPVALTTTERRLLGYLVANRNRVVSKTQILTAVWGYEGFDENVVEVNVSALRRKLESGTGPRVLHTVRGRGYLFGTDLFGPGPIGPG